MDEWGFNPSTLSAIGSVSVLIAFIGLLFGNVQAKRARNLQAVLTISADFRERWETEWQSILNEKVPGMDLKARQEGEVGRQLTYMLNWLDWMGLMVRKRWIHKDLLFGSLAPVMANILRESADRIECDMQEKGEKWWDNALYMARHLEIDLSKEAEELRKTCGPPSNLQRGS